MLAKYVDTILIGFEDARKKIHHAKNIVLTGNPTKFKNVNLLDEEKKEIRIEKGLDPNKTLILAFGGSQGAKPINEALTGIVEKKLNKDYQILWSAGPSQYDVFKEKLKEN